MKITILDSIEIKEKITNILRKLNISNIEVILERKENYPINYESAVIINNVVIEEVNKMNNTDLTNIIKECLES